ncbi:hypothetical protein JVU11DRAFT_8426 [Chiua virens]|nr:hypothetical protein JVU11DRAFT_8426 [Chiua virens]
MFGESDSESPRVPSPWDSLTPLSFSPPTPGIPKLVPEAEEGNVEYKLQLLSPSPARFARLVTQLKWRLLEGGGQAYYELGVADSGTLVGLPRQQLEESLETLEMMAGEIGASVIVVKEIEVPPELSSLAESQLERWDGKRSARRKDLLRMKQDSSPTTSAAEFETDLLTTDATDAEDTTSYSPVTPPASLAGFMPTRLRPSPIPFPFDSPLAIFTMDAGDDVANFADNEAPDDDAQTHHGSEYSFNLEISTVYKPRPMKKRATYITSPPSVKPTYARKKLKNDYPASKCTDTSCNGDLGPSQTFPKPTEAEARMRRDKRDVRRELRLDALLTHVSTCCPPESPTNSVGHVTISPSTHNEHDPSLPVVVVDPPAGEESAITAVAPKNPRLIVEALVVRKLSLDEAFLDFEGFSLI